MAPEWGQFHTVFARGVLVAVAAGRGIGVQRVLWWEKACLPRVLADSGGRPKRVSSRWGPGRLPNNVPAWSRAKGIPYPFVEDLVDSPFARKRLAAIAG